MAKFVSSALRKVADGIERSLPSLPVYRTAVAYVKYRHERVRLFFKADKNNMLPPDIHNGANYHEWRKATRHERFETFRKRLMYGSAAAGAVLALYESAGHKHHTEAHAILGVTAGATIGLAVGWWAHLAAPVFAAGGSVIFVWKMLKRYRGTVGGGSHGRRK